MKHQAYKLPEGAIPLSIIQNDSTKEFAIQYEDRENGLMYKPIVGKHTKVNFSECIRNGVRKYWSDTPELRDFISECNKMDVVAPVLIIIYVK